MPKQTSKSEAASNSVKAAAPASEASPAQEAALAQGSMTKEQALARMQAMFTPERWARIERQALTVRGLRADDLQGLCLVMLNSRTARHPDNTSAASAAAANGLLLALGSSLRPEDIQRLEDALKGISAPAAETPAPEVTT